jgi:hypothetical protein
MFLDSSRPNTVVLAHLSSEPWKPGLAARSVEALVYRADCASRVIQSSEKEGP